MQSAKDPRERLVLKVALGVALFASFFIMSLSAASVSAPWCSFKNTASPVAGVTIETTITLTLTNVQSCYSAGKGTQCQSFSITESDSGLTAAAISGFKATHAMVVLASMAGAVCCAVAGLLVLAEFEFALGPLAVARGISLPVLLAASLFALIFAVSAVGVWNVGVADKVFDGTAFDGGSGLSTLGYSRQWSTGIGEAVAALVFAVTVASIALVTWLRCDAKS